MKLLITFYIYVCMTIYTFGHAYVNFPDTEKHWFAGEEYTAHNGRGFKTFGSLACGLSWPLYWSVQLQR